MWNAVFVLFSAVFVADANVKDHMYHVQPPWNPRTHKWIKIKPPKSSSYDNLYRVEIDDIRPSSKEKRVLHGYLFSDSVVQLLDMETEQDIKRYKWDEKSHKFIVEGESGIFTRKRITTQGLEEILNEKFANHDNIKIIFRRTLDNGKDLWYWYILPQHPSLVKPMRDCEGQDSQGTLVWFPIQVMVNKEAKQWGEVVVTTNNVLFTVNGDRYDTSGGWNQRLKVLRHDVEMSTAVHWHLRDYKGSVSCFWHNKRFLSIDPENAAFSAQVMEDDEEIEEKDAEMFRKGFYDGLRAAKLRERLNG